MFTSLLFGNSFAMIGVPPVSFWKADMNNRCQSILRALYCESQGVFWQ
jgi:hypothetical protein